MTPRPIYVIENLRRDLEIWRFIAISRKSQRRGTGSCIWETLSKQFENSGGGNCYPRGEKRTTAPPAQESRTASGSWVQVGLASANSTLDHGEEGSRLGRSKGPLVPNLGSRTGTLTISQLLGSPCTVPSAPAAGTSHSGTDVAAELPTPFMPRWDLTQRGQESPQVCWAAPPAPLRLWLDSSQGPASLIPEWQSRKRLRWLSRTSFRWWAGSSSPGTFPFFFFLINTQTI